MNLLKNHPLLSVFILALIVRLGCLAAHPEAGAVPTVGDASRYHGLAVHLLTGEGLEFNGHRAQVSPFYPLFVAGVYALTHQSIMTVLALQCLIGALMVLWIVLSAEIIAGKKAGIAAGVIAALYWPFATMSIQLLSETLFMLLMVISIYLLLAGMEQGNTRRILLSAAVFGLACLTRPVLLYFEILIAAALLFHQRDNSQPRKLLLPASYLLIVFLVMLPWGIRNKVVMGQWIFTNTNTGQVLLTGNKPRDGKLLGFDLNTGSLGPGNEYLLDEPELTRDKAYKRLAIEYLLQNPEKLPGLLVLKVAYLISPFDWELLGNPDGAFNPWFVWLMLFAIPGLFLVRWRWPTVLAPALLCYFLAIGMVTYFSPRLRLPQIPYLIVTAAAAWVGLEKRLDSRRKTVVLITVIAVTCVAGYHYSDSIKTAASSFLTSLGLW